MLNECLKPEISAESEIPRFIRVQGGSKWQYLEVGSLIPAERLSTSYKTGK
jgi:hypothetical protein